MSQAELNDSLLQAQKFNIAEASDSRDLAQQHQRIKIGRQLSTLERTSSQKQGFARMLPQPQMQPSRQSMQIRHSRHFHLLWPVPQQAHKGADNHPQFSKPLVLSPGHRLLSHRVVTTYHVVNMQSERAVKQAQGHLACRLVTYTLSSMTWDSVL